MILASPLFGFDVGGCVSLIVPVVFGVIWVLNQIFKNVNKAQPPAPRPGAAPRRPAAAVDQEIEAFLRRAAQAKGGAPPPGQPAAPQRPMNAPRPATAQRPRASQSPGRPAAPPPLPQANQPVRRLARTDEQPHSHESIEEHVGRHINTQDVGERADHLVKADRAVNELDQHVHRALDHQIGHLVSGASSPNPTDTAATVAIAPASAAAAGILQVLSTPEQLRNAVILTEIFQRPEEVWKRAR